jgi:hypothetical protein
MEEALQFEDSLGYLVRPCLKYQNKTKQKQIQFLQNFGIFNFYFTDL